MPGEMEPAPGPPRRRPPGRPERAPPPPRVADDRSTSTRRTFAHGRPSSSWCAGRGLFPCPPPAPPGPVASPASPRPPDRVIGTVQAPTRPPALRSKPPPGCRCASAAGRRVESGGRVRRPRHHRRPAPRHARRRRRGPDGVTRPGPAARVHDDGPRSEPARIDTGDLRAVAGRPEVFVPGSKTDRGSADAKVRCPAWGCRVPARPRRARRGAAGGLGFRAGPSPRSGAGAFVVPGDTRAGQGAGVAASRVATRGPVRGSEAASVKARSRVAR